MLNTFDLIDSLSTPENISNLLIPYGVEGSRGLLFGKPEIEKYGFNRYELTELPEMVQVYLSEDVHSLVLVLPMGFSSFQVVVVHALHCAGIHPDQIDIVVDLFCKVYQCKFPKRKST